MAERDVFINLETNIRPFREAAAQAARAMAGFSVALTNAYDKVRETGEHWFDSILDDKIRREELAAVPGQIECPGHRYAAKSGDHIFAGYTPCPGCKAVV